jgi:hypothetical protein
MRISPQKPQKGPKTPKISLYGETFTVQQNCPFFTVKLALFYGETPFFTEFTLQRKSDFENPWYH